MTRHEIVGVDELVSGECQIVTVNGQEIGIFNVNGTYCALRNVCPHQGAPLCRGTVDGTAMPSHPGEHIWRRQGEILRCPWHGWEFDLLTGISLFDQRYRVKTYRVELQDGRLVLMIQRRSRNGNKQSLQHYRSGETA